MFLKCDTQAYRSDQGISLCSHLSGACIVQELRKVSFSGAESLEKTHSLAHLLQLLTPHLAFNSSHPEMFLMSVLLRWAASAISISPLGAFVWGSASGPASIVV